MAMVCPQCSTIHQQRLQCPLCGTRLLFRDPKRAHKLGALGRFRQSFWGRVVVGLVLAQGLFYGLRHLVTGALLAAQGEEGLQETLQSQSGMTLLLALQVVALLPGAVLVGSGQRFGIVLGAILGIWNGAVGALIHAGTGQHLGTMALYGQPLLHTFFGALGGWVGSLIWKPAPLDLPGVPRPAKPAPRKRTPLFAGRVAWFRVALGTAVAVAGSLSAVLLLRWLLDLSAGTLSTADQAEDRLFAWEIRGLAVLLGGAVAGATTPNGLKQGLYVGLITTMILTGCQPQQHQGTWFQVVGLTLLSSFTLALAGGWFGCQLFPPVVRRARQRIGAI